MIRKPYAIALLLGTSVLFASNHIAARFAFDAGAGLVLAIVLRSAFSALIMSSVAVVQKQKFGVAKHQRYWLLAAGGFIALQSWCLYSSVAIMPIAVSLLLVNSWPVIYIGFSWAIGGSRPRLPLIIALGVILFGLPTQRPHSSPSTNQIK